MAWPKAGVTYRPTVAGSRGAVTSDHWLSSLAGMQMLLAGGNAVDAAVAVAAVLSVVEPYSTGAGGVGFMTIRVPGASAPVVLDFDGRTPAAATLEAFSEPGAKDYGFRSVLVPGAVAGWLAALERYGALDRATVFAPAVHYAEAGFPMSANGYHHIWSIQDRLRQWPTTAAIYLPNGHAPTPGSILRQPDQGRTLRMIVEGGAEAFYRGPIAAEIVRFSQEHDGLLTQDDFTNFEVEWKQPIWASYRGYDVYCPPPPCAGLQFLLALNVLEGFDLTAMGQNSPDSIHYIAEASKLAIADRIRYIADGLIPPANLLSAEYAADLRTRIDPDRAPRSNGQMHSGAALASAPVGPASVLRENTTHFVTADASGYVVACMYSLGGGAGVVHGSTGLALNNMGHIFDDDLESPNVIGPNKKVAMPMCPSQVW